MGRKILLDGKITYTDNVNIHPGSPALNYGMGLFETMLYENGRFFFLEDHISRLNTSCTSLGLTVPEEYSLEEELLYDFAEQSGMREKTARIKIIHAPLFSNDKWNTAVFCDSYERKNESVQAIFYAAPRENPFNRHKTLSYMQNIVALKDQNKFDEVLFTNIRGNIIEGAKSNIMAVRNSTLYFVDKDENYLQGIMQKNILKDHAKLGFKDALPVSGGFSPGSLNSFDEIIMSNSLVVANSIILIHQDHEIIKIRVSDYSENIRKFYLTK